MPCSNARGTHARTSASDKLHGVSSGSLSDALGSTPFDSSSPPAAWPTPAPGLLHDLCLMVKLVPGANDCAIQPAACRHSAGATVAVGNPRGSREPRLNRESDVYLVRQPTGEVSAVQVACRPQSTNGGLT